MTWIGEHWLVFVMLLAYTALMAHHAVIGKRATRGRTDYYVGGRTMGGIAIGISFFATYSSTNSFVGFSGQAYTYGVAWLLVIPSVVVFCMVAWLWVAPRLRSFTAAVGSVTLPDYIGLRFGSNQARVLAALIVIFASLLYMTAIFKGIGNLIEIFLDLPYSVSIAIVFFIVMAYTAVGGFISVVKTDVVQGVVMSFAAVLLSGFTVAAAGGIGTFFEVGRQPEAAHLFTWDAAMAFPVLLGIIVAGTLKFVVEPRQLSRFYALADARAVRRGALVSTAAFLVVYTLLVPIGIYARSIIPDPLSDSDLVVPTLLSSGTVFPPAIASFLLVAMVAAAMSSLDSVLLVVASTWERDVVSLLRRGETEILAVRATRWYVALFALVTALIALRPPGGIVTLTAFSGSLYAACFFPAVVLGLHWHRGNGGAVIASFVTGIATLLLWRYLPYGVVIHPVFPAMILSTGAFVGLASLAPPHSTSAVKALFSDR
jgi:SSS family transporter